MTSNTKQISHSNGNTCLLQNIPRAIETELWFDDGNIILVAEDTPFKVHRGQLSQRSQVFRDILLIPQPRVPDGSDVMDGVPLIHVSDTWKDLSYVLSALYNRYKWMCSCTFKLQRTLNDQFLPFFSLQGFSIIPSHGHSQQSALSSGWDISMKPPSCERLPPLD